MNKENNQPFMPGLILKYVGKRVSTNEDLDDSINIDLYEIKESKTIKTYIDQEGREIIIDGKGTNEKDKEDNIYFTLEELQRLIDDIQSEADMDI